MTMTSDKKIIKNCASFSTREKRAYFNNSTNNDEDCDTLEVFEKGDINITKQLIGTYFEHGNEYGIFDISFGGSLPSGEPLSIQDIVPENAWIEDINTTGWNCTPTALPINSGLSLECSIVGPYQAIPNLRVTMGLDANKSCKVENCVAIIDGKGTYYNQDSSNDNSCDTVVNPPRSDIALHKNLHTQYEENGTLYGIFKITFDGILPAGEVLTVDDFVPEESRFTEINASAWNCSATPLESNETLSCNITGPLAPIPSIFVTMEINQSAEGNISNCASIRNNNHREYYNTDLSNDDSCDTIEIPICTGSCIPLSCTTDIIVVADESGSIASPINHTSTVQTSIRTLLGGFKGYGSKASVIYFSDTNMNHSRIRTPMQTIETFNGYPFQENQMMSGYNPTNGETNWEKGLRLAIQEANANPGPEVIFFITDGQPNKYIDDTTGQEESGTEAYALTQAVAVANQLNTNGSRIVAIGVGDFSASPTAQSNLEQIASEVNDSIVVPISELQNVIAQYAYEACPTLSLVKKTHSSPYATGRNINLFYYDINTLTTYFFLQLHNSSLIDLHNVVVEDALPTPAIIFDSFPNTPAGTAATENANVITWTIPLIHSGETKTLTYNVSFDPNTQGGDRYDNFAQVVSLDENISSTPNSFLDPVTGPINLSERDEGSAYITFTDQNTSGGGNPPCQATTQAPNRCLSVSKAMSLGEGNCQPGHACLYTVTIYNTSNQAYSGTLNMEDHFDTGSANITSITSMTTAYQSGSTPSSLCTSAPTSVPFTCSYTNSNIPAYGRWTFKIELDNTPPNATTNTFTVNGRSSTMGL